MGFSLCINFVGILLWQALSSRLAKHIREGIPEADNSLCVTVFPQVCSVTFFEKF